MERLSSVNLRINSMPLEQKPASHYNLRFGTVDAPADKPPADNSTGSCLGAPFRLLSKLNTALEKGLDHIDDGLKQITNASPLSRPVDTLAAKANNNDGLLGNPTVRKFTDDISTSFDNLLKAVFGEDPKQTAQPAGLASANNTGDRKQYYADLLKTFENHPDIKPLLQTAKAQNPLETDVNKQIAHSLAHFESKMIEGGNWVNNLNAKSDAERIGGLKDIMSEVILRKPSEPSNTPSV